MTPVQLAKKIVREHKPKSQDGAKYCLGCPQEDWGHRDFGPASAPCELYILATALLKVKS